MCLTQFKGQNCASLNHVLQALTTHFHQAKSNGDTEINTITKQSKMQLTVPAIYMPSKIFLCTAKFLWSCIMESNQPSGRKELPHHGEINKGKQQTAELRQGVLAILHILRDYTSLSPPTWKKIFGPTKILKNPTKSPLCELHCFFSCTTQLSSWLFPNCLCCSKGCLVQTDAMVEDQQLS